MLALYHAVLTRYSAHATHLYMQAYATEIAEHEIAHVRFLQTALGNNSVPCPALNIGTAFSAAADAATNSTLDPPYSPYYDDKWFTLGAFIFEGESLFTFADVAVWRYCILLATCSHNIATCCTAQHAA
jgi:Ferritin-like domain